MATRIPPRSVSLGGAAWNTMVYVDHFPEPVPGTVYTRGYHETVGSSGAGKALNMKALGAASTLWALLGDDEYGAKIRRYMKDRDVELVTGVEPAGTVRHVNLMDRAGDRISLFANGGSHEIQIDPAPILPALRAADIVSVTIVNYCRQFLPILTAMGKPVAIDIHNYDGVNPYHDDFIEAADYLFMSSLQLDEWRDFLERRVAAGTTVGVCTHGSNGASGFTAGDGWVDIPAVPVRTLVDSNGAGDAFYAGFMMSWLAGSGLENSMLAGATSGAAAVQVPDLAPL